LAPGRCRRAHSRRSGSVKDLHVRRSRPGEVSAIEFAVGLNGVCREDGDAEQEKKRLLKRPSARLLGCQSGEGAPQEFAVDPVDDGLQHDRPLI
jgi:hypothetical protein